jgi:hypothetical protein
VEDTVAWLGFALGLIGACVALEVGTAEYATGMDQVQIEAAQRTPITVTLVNNAEYPAYAAGPAPAIETAVHWTSHDGTEHTALTPRR